MRTVLSSALDKNNGVVSIEDILFLKAHCFGFVDNLFSRMRQHSSGRAVM